MTPNLKIPNEAQRMRHYNYIKFETINEIGYITLNRPEKHNALHPALMDELTELCETLSKLTDIRVVILNAEGNNFCSGADLDWMSQQIDNSFNENKDSAIQLGVFLHKLSTLPQPLIGLVHGQVFGGGLGLIACCDIVIAATNSAFCFSEVTLGLVPAMITPYVIRKIGFSQAKALFLTAEIFDTVQAKNINLIHHQCEVTELKETAQKIAEKLKKNAPLAMAQSKQLVDQFYPIEPQMIDFTAEILAHLRVGEEAQERMKKFLKK